MHVLMRLGSAELGGGSPAATFHDVPSSLVCSLTLSGVRSSQAEAEEVPGVGNPQLWSCMRLFRPYTAAP